MILIGVTGWLLRVRHAYAWDGAASRSVSEIPLLISNQKELGWLHVFSYTQKDGPISGSIDTVHECGLVMGRRRLKLVVNASNERRGYHINSLDTTNVLIGESFAGSGVRTIIRFVSKENDVGWSIAGCREHLTGCLLFFLEVPPLSGPQVNDEAQSDSNVAGHGMANVLVLRDYVKHNTIDGTKLDWSAQSRQVYWKVRPCKRDYRAFNVDEFYPRPVSSLELLLHYGHLNASAIGLLLDLAQSATGYDDVGNDREQSPKTNRKLGTFPSNLRLAILVLGVIITGYAWWQVYFRTDRYLWAWLILTCFGLVLFGYGFKLYIDLI
jgi:hypothetical protein